MTPIAAASARAKSAEGLLSGNLFFDSASGLTTLIYDGWEWTVPRFQRESAPAVRFLSPQLNGLQRATFLTRSHSAVQRVPPSRSCA